MKKPFAVVLIALFTLMLIGGSVNIAQHPAPRGDIAYTVGQLCGFLLVIAFLFYSVRWYIKLNGHTYKLARQTWASILFWYSMLALLMGFAFLFGRQVGLGVIYLVLWGSIAFGCWKWRQRLRRAETQLKPQAPVSL